MLLVPRGTCSSIVRMTTDEESIGIGLDDVPPMPGFGTPRIRSSISAMATQACVSLGIWTTSRPINVILEFKISLIVAASTKISSGFLFFNSSMRDLISLISSGVINFFTILYVIDIQGFIQSIFFRENCCVISPEKILFGCRD